MIWIIIGMAVVTYVPRTVPFYLLRSRHTPPFLARVLRQIPAAALGALIVPGVYDAVSGEPAASLIGAVVSAIAAALSRNVLITLIAGLSATTLVLALL
jgi:branched-subunit amino acid transport protein